MRSASARRAPAWPGRPRSIPAWNAPSNSRNWRPMFEALVITLREGVEAVLVLAIALASLRRRGEGHLAPALYAGTALALALSVGVAALATRVTWNEELAEGIAMLIGAALVISLVVWMWRAAPHMKAEIESGLARATSGGTVAGVVFFAFA